jgi:hypothetical protein
MSAAARLSQLPDWPGRLGEEEAAAYLGLSKSGVREKWAAAGSSYPQPAREAGRIFWSRRQLDAWIDCQFGLSQSPAPSGGGGRTKGWAK